MNKPIYHITHVDNLEGIIKEGGLWCDSKCRATAKTNMNVGYSHIKARRMTRKVDVAAGGTLGEYVPFNFCNRSVMLYVLYRGHDEYNGGQDSIVHLVSSIASAQATGIPWFFTDLHADLGYAQQYDDLALLGQVDWEVMPRRQWGGDSEVKEKRQAEFLVHDFFPWTAIDVIGVVDKDIASVVRDTIAGSDHQPQVKIKRNWYY